VGCGFEQLAALNPRLVYLALKGYLAGPNERRPALDEVVQFQTGLAFMTGRRWQGCARPRLRAR
jgi:crotonobetainyl-CoA:carnitine CoA-transferase CaiB-like acyl-CoA transferase